MSSSLQFTSSRTISTEELISIEQTNASDPSALIKKQRNKTSLSFSSNKKIRVVDEKSKHLNYNELNDLN